ncbi:MAG TPA: hypothetical protein VKJ01_18025 [Candidatus Solibacter sp.]|nr:hypothetical protein [Candidatus Solibacter sp.]
MALAAARDVEPHAVFNQKLRHRCVNGNPRSHQPGQIGRVFVDGAIGQQQLDHAVIHEQVHRDPIPFRVDVANGAVNLHPIAEMKAGCQIPESTPRRRRQLCMPHHPEIGILNDRGAGTLPRTPGQIHHVAGLERKPPIAQLDGDSGNAIVNE